MSVATEITRLQGAKADIKSAIEAKGVTVPANTLLDGYATLISQISGGGTTGLEYESGSFKPTNDIVRPEISFAKNHSVPPAILTFYDAGGTVSDQNTGIAMTYIDVYRLFGGSYTYNANTSSNRYATIHYLYRGTSATSINSGTTHFSYNSDDTTASGTSYSRYWVGTSNFHPYTSSGSRYWRSTRTYKWIAIWV